MKARTRIIIYVILFLIFLFFYKGWELPFQKEKMVYEDGSVEAYFCKTSNCTEVLVDFIQGSESVKCAFYDLNLPEVIKALESRNSSVVLDDENNIKIRAEKKVDSYSLMHNKFCVSGNKVLTGSMNPTFNDAYKNDNNIVVLTSKTIAKNYEKEFDEMFEGYFKGGEKTKTSKIIMNGTIVEAYFCPEDQCANKIIKEIQKANQSVYFMTFSFTHDEISGALLGKSSEGLQVKGVFETTQISNYSVYEQLVESKLDVHKDGNKNNMHHKVFIIDEKTVITGSMNPTANGDKRNDENIVIIHDEKIAKQFVQEFERVYGISQQI